MSMINSEQDVHKHWSVGGRVWSDRNFLFRDLGQFTPSEYTHFVQTAASSRGQARTFGLPLGGEIFVVTESRTGTDDDRRVWGADWSRSTEGCWDRDEGFQTFEPNLAATDGGEPRAAAVQSSDVCYYQKVQGNGIVSVPADSGGPAQGCRMQIFVRAPQLKILPSSNELMAAARQSAKKCGRSTLLKIENGTEVNLHLHGFQATIGVWGVRPPERISPGQVAVMVSQSAFMTSSEAMAVYSVGGSPVWKCGYMEKRGEFNTDWQRRWFQLQADEMLLVYAVNEKGDTRKGHVNLREVVQISGSNETGINLQTPTRTFFFRAENAAEKARWIQKLNIVIASGRAEVGCPILRARWANPLVQLPVGFTMAADTVNFGTSLVLEVQKDDKDANNEVVLRVGARFSPRGALSSLSQHEHPEQYMIVTMRPGDGIGEHEWEIRRFGDDRVAAQATFSSPVAAPLHHAHLLFMVSKQPRQQSWKADKIDKYGRPGLESKLLIGANWEAQKLSILQNGWRAPKDHEFPEGNSLVGQRVYILGKGPGRVVEYKNPLIGAAVHSVALDSGGGKRRDIKLFRKGKSEPPYCIWDERLRRELSSEESDSTQKVAPELSECPAWATPCRYGGACRMRADSTHMNSYWHPPLAKATTSIFKSLIAVAEPEAEISETPRAEVKPPVQVDQELQKEEHQREQQAMQTAVLPEPEPGDFDEDEEPEQESLEPGPELEPDTEPERHLPEPEPGLEPEFESELPQYDADTAEANEWLLAHGLSPSEQDRIQSMFEDQGQRFCVQTLNGLEVDEVKKAAGRIPEGSSSSSSSLLSETVKNDGSGLSRTTSCVVAGAFSPREHQGSNITVIFGNPGPLGLNLFADTQTGPKMLSSLVPGSTSSTFPALQQFFSAVDGTALKNTCLYIISIAGRDVTNITFDGTLQMLRTLPRPLAMTFLQAAQPPSAQTRIDTPGSLKKVQMRFQQVLKQTTALRALADIRKDGGVDDDSSDSDSDTEMYTGSAEDEGAMSDMAEPQAAESSSFVSDFDRDAFREKWVTQFQRNMDTHSIEFLSDGSPWEDSLDSQTRLQAYQASLAVIVGGSLQQELRSQLQRSISNDGAALRKDLALEECFENERSIFGSWSGSHLLPTERDHWSDRDGKTHEGLPSVGLPAGTHGHQWHWVNTWEIDKDERLCDKDGWMYAGSFMAALLGWRRSTGLVRPVRRRRWVRIRKLGELDDASLGRAAMSAHMRAMVIHSREAGIKNRVGAPAVAAADDANLTDDERTRKKHALQRGMRVSAGRVPSFEQIEDFDAQARRSRLSSATIDEVEQRGSESSLMSIDGGDRRHVATKRGVVRMEADGDAAYLGRLKVGCVIEEIERRTRGSGKHYIRTRIDSTNAYNVEAATGTVEGWVCTTTDSGVPIFLPYEADVPLALTHDDCRALREPILRDFDDNQFLSRTRSDGEGQRLRKLQNLEKSMRDLHAMTFSQAHTKLQRNNSFRNAYVTVHNDTGYTLIRVSTLTKNDGVSSGRWICQPPQDIFPRERNIPFGSQSSMFMTGTEGRVEYTASRVREYKGKDAQTDGQKFTIVMTWDISVALGSNNILTCTADSPLSICVEHDNASHCRCTFYITDMIKEFQSPGMMNGQPVARISDVTWQWKRNDGAWVSYPPAESERIERAHLAKVRSVTVPPHYKIDFESMELRRADSLADSSSTGSRPVQRVAPEQGEQSTSLAVHKKALPVAISQRLQLLDQMDSYLSLISQDQHQLYNPSNFPPDNDQEFPYAWWKNAEIERLLNTTTILKGKPLFEGFLAIKFMVGERFLPSVGWKDQGKLRVRVRVKTGVVMEERTVRHSIDQSGKVTFSEEQLRFALAAEPRFIVFEALYGKEKIVLGSGGINPICPSKLWCPAPNFKDIRVDITCPAPKWRDIGYAAQPTTTASITVQMQYFFKSSANAAAARPAIIVPVGTSSAAVKNVELPGAGFSVSSVPQNAQGLYKGKPWPDTFETSVKGNKLTIRRVDEAAGWGQNLQLLATPPPPPLSAVGEVASLLDGHRFLRVCMRSVYLQPCSEIIDGPPKTAATQSECQICACVCEQGDSSYTLPCSHTYHSDCLKDWMSHSGICPTCDSSYKWFWQQFVMYYNIRPVYQKLFQLRVHVDNFDASAHWFRRVHTDLSDINKCLQLNSLWDRNDGMTIQENDMYVSLKDHIRILISRCLVNFRLVWPMSSHSDTDRVSDGSLKTAFSLFDFVTDKPELAITNLLRTHARRLVASLCGTKIVPFGFNLSGDNTVFQAHEGHIVGEVLQELCDVLNEEIELIRTTNGYFDEIFDGTFSPWNLRAADILCNE